MNEEQMQRSVILESDYRAGLDPRWGYLYHVPNGGLRDKIVAAKLKAQGVRAGVPDLCLPVPRASDGEYPGYHGLYLELKCGDNEATAHQLRWQGFLAQQGYFVQTVFDDPQVVTDVIQWYLRGAP